MKASVFDIIGPVMIGPSSSHTAGAVRLGQIARAILGEKPQEVKILLNLPFWNKKDQYFTESALVSGLLGFGPQDERIKSATELAKVNKIKLEIKPLDFGLGYHENSVRFILRNKKQKIEVVGASIGSGNINIQKINDIPVNFTGTVYSSEVLIIAHKSRIGILAEITDILNKDKAFISSMQSTSVEKSQDMLTIIELEVRSKRELIDDLRRIKDVHYVRSISRETTSKI